MVRWQEHVISSAGGIACFYSQMIALVCRPNPLTKAAVEAEYRANVSNLRNSSHSTVQMPPVSLAENLKVADITRMIWSSAIAAGWQPDTSMAGMDGGH